ncbi:phosphoglycolate phosphatase [Fibrisoma limi BUZ 3]|uniref:phosphoglycolate phosphatase n=1 Tax=Fibrisoma limi BUZ 3 TaxID=1185876 RepID=I2GFZ4_9BACT|nr:HAD family hydrolase [Fibrisoma limi]CCH52819.1 phosphoglycolate phosphatase [Fibrisoma limi BUZ 3]
MKNPFAAAFLLDLDGTLADTLPLCIQAFRQSIEPLANRQLTDEEIIATFGPSEEGTIRALIPDYVDQGITSYLRFYESLHGMCSQPFPGITQLLETLQKRRVRLGLVTGKGEHSTRISLQQFRLASYFEYVETGWVHGPRKVDGIKAILSQWSDLPKENVWYVGDAPSDILASREVGIPFVAAAWARTADVNQLRALQPNELFTSVDDFVNWTEGVTMSHSPMQD